MKRIIDIPEEVVTAIQNGEDYRYDIHTAIAQGIPYEPQGDLISREALKEDLAKEIKTNDLGLWLKILLVIDNAPTVDIKDQIAGAYNEGYMCGNKEAEKARPQGEWIITGEEQGALGIIYKMRKCNKCGWENSLLIPRNFCPNCGAKMKGGAENGKD